MNCSVCESVLTPLLDLDPGWCINSLGALLETEGQVYSCAYCSHCETRVRLDLSIYYESSYKTLAHSPDEDDLYALENGIPVYRADHMTCIFLEKMGDILNGGKNINLLDFGCGKSLFGKRISAKNIGVNLHLFDVSDDYRGFWSDFCNADSISTFSIPDEWINKFDIVTSLFSLEHVPDPLEILRQVRLLLKDGGTFYIIVPNMYSENDSDILVVDHLHHYSPLSMRKMVGICGFSLSDEDTTSHRQASIYRATKISDVDNAATVILPRSGIDEYTNRQIAVSQVWKNYTASLQDFVDSSDRDRPVVIVGAGVLGSLSIAILNQNPRIEGYIDSNVFKQKKGWLDRPVYAPGCLPDSLVSRRPLFIMSLNTVLIESIGMTLLPENTPKESVWVPPGSHMDFP